MRRGKITAWISTSHDVLPESDTVQEKNSAVCWVPSRVGEAFRIGYSAAARTYGLKVSVYIDGELAAEQTHAAPKRKNHVLRDGIRSRKDGSGIERPFLFRQRSITDNDMDFVPETQLTDLGSIKVKFTWIIADHNSLSQSPCVNFRAPNAHHRPIYEGLIKRRAGEIAHAAGLGATRKIGPSWISQKRHIMMHRVTKDASRPLRWRETGLYTTAFEFKYAPAEYLSTEGILDCLPPTPVPQTPRVAQLNSPWRSHVGTPYRELRANSSFIGTTPRPLKSRPFWFSHDYGLDFGTPQVKLGSHVVTNLTPLAQLGSHTIAHPIKMSPLMKISPLIGVKVEEDDGEILEISAQEFYRRETIDLTGLDSDSD